MSDLPRDVREIIDAANLNLEFYADDWEETGIALGVVSDILARTGDVRKALTALLHESIAERCHGDYWVSFPRGIEGMAQALEKLPATEKVDVMIHVLECSGEPGIHGATRAGVILSMLVERYIGFSSDDEVAAVSDLLEFAVKCSVFEDAPSQNVASLSQEQLQAAYRALKKLLATP